MKARKILIALSILIVPVSGYLVLPSPEERIAMLVRDGRSDEALRELEPLLVRGDIKPNLLAAAARLYDAADRPVQAAWLAESYIKARPQDWEALEWLTHLYAASENIDGLISAQARLVAIQPTRERLLKLLGLYRLHGRFGEEREVLTRLWESPLLEVSDRERLGSLLAANGDVERAVMVLRHLDASMPEQEEQNRLLLFELLAKTQRTSEAAALGAKWLAHWQKPWLAVSLVRQLAQTGREIDARALASSAVDIHPELKFYLARTLALEGSAAIAASLLESWPQSDSEPPLNEIEGYLAAAQAVGDTQAIWRKFAAIASHPSWFRAQGFFAEALAARHGIGAVASMRPQPSLAALSTRPLFATRFALAQNNRPLARWFLMRADIRSLSATDQRFWVDLLRETAGDRAALTYLSDLLRDRRLHSDLTATYVQLGQHMRTSPEPVAKGRPHRLNMAQMARYAGR